MASEDSWPSDTHSARADDDVQTSRDRRARPDVDTEDEIEDEVADGMASGPASVQRYSPPASTISTDAGAMADDLWASPAKPEASATADESAITAASPSEQQVGQRSRTGEHGRGA